MWMKIKLNSGIAFCDQARVWNVSDGQCHMVLKGHTSALHSAVFSAGWGRFHRKTETEHIQNSSISHQKETRGKNCVWTNNIPKISETQYRQLLPTRHSFKNLRYFGFKDSLPRTRCATNSAGFKQNLFKCLNKMTTTEWSLMLFSMFLYVPGLV